MGARPEMVLLMTHAEVVAALRERYPAPEYAFFTEVPDEVGFGNRMDALAMAMWRSRGLEIHGFEIKCSRSDWLREKKRPHKADGFFSRSGEDRSGVHCRHSEEGWSGRKHFAIRRQLGKATVPASSHLGGTEAKRGIR